MERSVNDNKEVRVDLKQKTINVKELEIKNNKQFMIGNFFENITVNKDGYTHDPYDSKEYDSAIGLSLVFINIKHGGDIIRLHSYMLENEACKLLEDELSKDISGKFVAVYAWGRTLITQLDSCLYWSKTVLDTPTISIKGIKKPGFFVTKQRSSGSGCSFLLLGDYQRPEKLYFTPESIHDGADCEQEPENNVIFGHYSPELANGIGYNEDDKTALKSICINTNIRDTISTMKMKTVPTCLYNSSDFGHLARANADDYLCILTHKPTAALEKLIVEYSKPERDRGPFDWENPYNLYDNRTRITVSTHGTVKEELTLLKPLTQDVIDNILYNCRFTVLEMLRSYVYEYLEDIMFLLTKQPGRHDGRDPELSRQCKAEYKTVKYMHYLELCLNANLLTNEQELPEKQIQNIIDLNEILQLERVNQTIPGVGSFKVDNILQPFMERLKKLNPEHALLGTEYETWYEERLKLNPNNTSRSSEVKPKATEW